MKRFIRALRHVAIRRKATARRERPRLFVVVDYSLFRTEWRFFAVRGMEEARSRCKNWVRCHPYGSASILNPHVFREEWRERKRTCVQFCPTPLDAARAATGRL